MHDTTCCPSLAAGNFNSSHSSTTSLGRRGRGRRGRERGEREEGERREGGEERE